jgi:drug/metabolite transporter (DMT)-like permease
MGAAGGTDLVGLALALSASLCWGVADFVGGLQARRLPLLQVILVSQAVALAVLAAVVLASWHSPPRLVHLVAPAAAGLAGMAGLMAFYRALAIGTMSIVAPIAATGVCVPVVVGIAGGDRPAILQLAGILAAVVGVVLVSREPDRGSEHRKIARASVTLALVAALGFGSFAVGLRAGARYDVLWALVAARVPGVLALAVAFLIRRPAAGGSARVYAPLAAMGMLDLFANGLYAVATRHGLLSVIAVAASLYPLATVLLARGLLGERVRRIQEIGIATAIAGIALIAAG